MKTVTKIAAQGDVLFERVDRLPSGAVPTKREGDVVVAHSETGHHHSIADKAVTKYEVPGSALECYLSFDGAPEAGGVDVVHHRSYHTHETLRLLGDTGAIWRVRRQREWSPWGDRMVQD